MHSPKITQIQLPRSTSTPIKSVRGPLNLMRESSWEGGESYQEPEVGDPLSLEGKKILIKEEKEDPPTNQREATSATIEEQGEEYWQQQYDEVRRLEEQLMAIQGFKEMDRQESIQNDWELKFKEVVEDLTLWKNKHDQVEESLQQQYNETKKLEEQLVVAKDSQIRDATEISNLKDELQHRTTELNDCRKQRLDDQNQAKADIEDNYRRKIIGLQDSLEKANLKAAQLANSLGVRELEIEDLKANIRNLQEGVEKGVEQSARCFNLQQDNDKLKKKLEDLHRQVQELKRKLNLRGNSESRTCDSGCSNGKSHSGGNGRRSEKPNRKDPEGQHFKSRPTNHNQAPSRKSDNHERSGRPHSTHRRRHGDSPDGSDPSSPESSNNYYADSGEDDLYKRSKGWSANFSTHPTKVRQKIALLQAELWSTREDIHEDYVLSQEDVATLSSDVLRMHMRNEEHHQYKKDIAKIKMKLEKLKIRFSDELSLVDRNSIEIALLSCNNMKQDVINTRDRIREAAKAKNVKLEINRKNGGRKPTFSGDPRETTIVEFLSQVDSYADRCGIPYEELGLLIKNQCKRRAKEVVLEEFGIIDNPNPEEIKTCLKKHFGHKNMVMSEIVSIHLSIGVIPEPVKYGEDRKKNLQSAKDILDKTRKHLVMIKKSAPFRPRPPAEDPLDEFALHDEYIQILIGVLPSRERNEYYKNHMNHHGETKLYYIIDLLEDIKSTVQDIVIRGNLMANLDDPDQENKEGEQDAYEKGEQMYESDDGEVYCKEEPSTPDHQGEEGEPENDQPDGDIWPQECMEECDEW